MIYPRDPDENFDVYFSRGRGENNLKGNMRYRALINENYETFNATDCIIRKESILNDIVRTLEQLGAKFFHGPYFDDTSNNPIQWRELKRGEVEKKLRQALNDKNRVKKPQHRHRTSPTKRRKNNATRSDYDESIQLPRIHDDKKDLNYDDSLRNKRYYDELRSSYDSATNKETFNTAVSCYTERKEELIGRETIVKTIENRGSSLHVQSFGVQFDNNFRHHLVPSVETVPLANSNYQHHYHQHHQQHCEQHQGHHQQHNYDTFMADVTSSTNESYKARQQTTSPTITKISHFSHYYEQQTSNCNNIFFGDNGGVLQHSHHDKEEAPADPEIMDQSSFESFFEGLKEHNDIDELSFASFEGAGTETKEL